jgi:hypothetical protein
MNGPGTEEMSMDSWLKNQRQVALIWMSDVNRAAAERAPRGMLTRLASHENFEMVEVHLSR